MEASICAHTSQSLLFAVRLRLENVPGQVNLLQRSMAAFDPSSHPHRRCMTSFHRAVLQSDTIIVNPLTGEHVLISPHRTKRPWQGQTEPLQPSPSHYEPSCYLCPGNARSGGQHNEQYPHTLVGARHLLTSYSTDRALGIRERLSRSSTSSRSRASGGRTSAPNFDTSRRDM
jgi:Galactose-1-phosphate uridyl transferase, N-terminal domain